MRKSLIRSQKIQIRMQEYKTSTQKYIYWVLHFFNNSDILILLAFLFDILSRLFE